MCQPGAERGGQDRGQGDADGGRQVDVADRLRRQRARRGVERVADRAADADRHAAGRGRADRAHRRDAAPDQQRHGHAAAADADYRRDCADAGAGGGHHQAPRHDFAAVGGTHPPERHLRRGHEAVAGDAPGQHLAIERDREQTAQPAAEQQARHHPAHRRPQHAAAAMVRVCRRQRGQHDARQRTCQRGVHRRILRHAVQRQQPDQCRDQHQTAADAEQSGEQAGDDAEQREHPEALGHMRSRSVPLIVLHNIRRSPSRACGRGWREAPVRVRLWSCVHKVKAGPLPASLREAAPRCAPPGPRA